MRRTVSPRSAEREGGEDRDLKYCEGAGTLSESKFRVLFLAFLHGKGDDMGCVTIGADMRCGDSAM